MSSKDPSLRLRPWASLVLFLSAYSPLLVILVIKDYPRDNSSWLPQNPILSGSLLFIAISSSLAIIRSVQEVKTGLPVIITKAANKSGDMFGYTIPYMISFLRIDLHDWQTLACIFIFLAILFIMAYRTQSVFVNPILALTGYMLLDCTFKRGNSEIQAMVITRSPLKIGQSCQMERLSHYLYIATPNNKQESTDGNHGK